MKTFATCTDIRALIQQYKAQNETIALVPTMGHLHAGHLSLIELAKTRATKVIVSIFINPIQFNQDSDFINYPRSQKQDIEKLEQLNIAAVFIPDINELYPLGTAQAARISIPQLEEKLEGEFRPGHFNGVCTVVCKLFNIITPNLAVFGTKDYQQLLIIRRLVEALNFSIEIVAGDTLRETNGLAMSSRNTHLSPEQRELASTIHLTTKHTMEQFSAKDISTLEKNATDLLQQTGFRVEYFTIVDAENLLPVTQDTENIVILVAAWLANTRLIDSLLFPMR